MSKDSSPNFLSCMNCIHLVNPEQPVCSAVKAIQAFKKQWEEEYPNVKIPSTWYDIAKFCSDYTALPDLKAEYSKQDQENLK